jgi:hypothetical protein
MQAARAANPFKVVIPDELFEAHEWLVRQLGGPSQLVKAQALAVRPRPGLENIEAIFIGKKWTDDGPTGQLCVKVHVRTKVTSHGQIDSAATIPPVIKVNGKEYPTDVESVGDVVAHQGFRDREQPARDGSSIGVLAGGVTGTLGALVVLDDGKLCLLSNNHVLAAVNSLPEGAQVIQPGLADADNQDPANTYVIGTLLKYVPLNLGGTSPVDAAVAWTSRDVASAHHRTFDYDPDPLEAELNMPVMKDGRTTGHTEGQVIGVHGVVSGVQYERPDGTFAYSSFTEQLVIRGIGVTFSDRGDSGSLIVHQSSRQPVALLFSGAEDVTYANPIGEVLAQLGVDHFAPLE